MTLQLKLQWYTKFLAFQLAKMCQMIPCTGNWRREAFSQLIKSAYWVARDLTMGNILAQSSTGGVFDQLWKAFWNANVPGNWQLFAFGERVMNCCLLEINFELEAIKVSLIAYYVLILLNPWDMFCANVLLQEIFWKQLPLISA